jgi:hypothetical protein
MKLMDGRKNKKFTRRECVLSFLTVSAERIKKPSVPSVTPVSLRAGGEKM